MRTIVVALGQSAAGDDAVGLAVLDEIERRGVPPGANLVRASDAMELVALFEDGGRLVLVDAVLGTPPGVVVDVALEDLSRRAPQPASSHGMGAAQAFDLARALVEAPAGQPEVHVVAVTIHRPDRYRVGLSPAVASAVSGAADRVLWHLGG